MEGVAANLRGAHALLPQYMVAAALSVARDAEGLYGAVLAGSGSEMARHIHEDMATAVEALRVALDALGRVSSHTGEYLDRCGVGGADQRPEVIERRSPNPAFLPTFYTAWTAATDLLREERVRSRGVNTEEALTLQVIAGLTRGGEACYMSQIRAYPEQDPRTVQRILERFEEEGLLISSMAESTGGRAGRRLYRPTPLGQRILGMFPEVDRPATR